MVCNTFVCEAEKINDAIESVTELLCSTLIPVSTVETTDGPHSQHGVRVNERSWYGVRSHDGHAEPAVFISHCCENGIVTARSVSERAIWRIFLSTVFCLCSNVCL